MIDYMLTDIKRVRLNIQPVSHKVILEANIIYYHVISGYINIAIAQRYNIMADESLFCGYFEVKR